MLNIGWGDIFEGYGTFGKRIQSSIFYCLCFVEEISVNIADKKAMEERDQILSRRRISLFLMIGGITGRKLKRKRMRKVVSSMP